MTRRIKTSSTPSVCGKYDGGWPAAVVLFRDALSDPAEKTRTLSHSLAESERASRVFLH
jgi:hypothetical protein